MKILPYPDVKIPNANNVRPYAGGWIDVDTSNLSSNGYHTLLYGYLNDDTVWKVVDDARIGKGVCRYCGAIVTKETEGEHYLKQEAKSCTDCWWCRPSFKRISEEKTETQTVENGRPVKTTIVTTKTDLSKRCTYEQAGSVNCVNRACRASGIFWFTGKNTQGIRFPEGCKTPRLLVIFQNGNRYATQSLKFGSYSVDVFGRAYRAHNSRTAVEFCFENDKIESVRRGRSSVKAIPFDTLQLINGFFRRRKYMYDALATDRTKGHPMEVVVSPLFERMLGYPYKQGFLADYLPEIIPLPENHELRKLLAYWGVTTRKYATLSDAFYMPIAADIVSMYETSLTV